MAIRPVGTPGDAKAPASERAPADKEKSAPASSRRSGPTARRPEPKPGIHTDEQHDLDHEQQLQRLRNDAAKVQDAQLKAKPAPIDELKKQLDQQRERQNRNMGGGSAGGGGAQGRADKARDLGFQTTPAVGDWVKGHEGPKGGSSFAEMLPQARTRGPALPEPDMRPPIFLSPFEGMKDIYLRVKGRASPKTRELLEGTGLEDLVKVVIAIQEDEAKAKAPEARLFGPLYNKVKADPGPLLIGLTDPRLAEPWRLFLEGWEIWVPDKKVDKAQSGVELFIEGEGEDDDGEPIPIVQMLRIIGSEVTLETTVGALKDRVFYDGNTFFRLKSDAAS